MSQVIPGVCRHCGCSESNACRLHDGDTCCWVDRMRVVCSNPKCQRAEQQRLAKARRMAPRKRTPAEVHAQIMEERRAQRRASRERRKARAA